MFDITVHTIYTSWYDYLPDEMREINCEYFRQKTTLKGAGVYYTKAKNLLNGIYGDFVMDPLRTRILYAGGHYKEDKSKDPAEILRRAGKQPYKVYQHGVWVTARARELLQRGIDLCGGRLVYCDTDSCKFVGAVDFGDLNAERLRKAISGNAYADDAKGVRHYMGIFEQEGVADAFITLGAKKYAYTDNKGLHLTVSGVPKIAGARELEAAGGLAAFQPGFVFQNTGKLESVYNDKPYGVYCRDGRRIAITKNVCLRPSTYTLNVTDEYSRLTGIPRAEIKKAIRHCQNMQL